MDNNLPHQELVKCVVVGDTAVGKTRLICSRATNHKVNLYQLLSTHVPTVWAIDQYRMCKDVLEKSWEEVDNVNVSLRLWDTFGEHDRDRRFAYSRSDVVLLCFSVTNRVSLRNCKSVWYPEIRKFCPNTPIVLVGCKNDIRFMFNDENYQSYCRERSPFVRMVREPDIVLPEEGRLIANELGIPYYETSVLTDFGVQDVFKNAIRAALICRRHQRLWMTSLKRVRRPQLQAPVCPPKPLMPEVDILESNWDQNLEDLLSQQSYTDVVLLAGNTGFYTHRFMLAAASPLFYRLFRDLLYDSNNGSGLTKWSSESSIVSSTGDISFGSYGTDTDYLVQSEANSFSFSRSPRFSDLRRGFSCETLENNLRPGLQREFDHPGIQYVRVEKCEASSQRTKPNCGIQIVLGLTKLISPSCVRDLLKFIYTGNLLGVKSSNWQELKQVAEFLEVTELQQCAANILSGEEFLNDTIIVHYKEYLGLRMSSTRVDSLLFSDVMFQLDDGVCSAHRAILMSRCDVMNAMFGGDFRESYCKVIPFPGVKSAIFGQLLHFLYSDRISSVKPSNCIPLLELANRLCLPRLINLVEQSVVTQLSQSPVKKSTMETIVKLLEPSQIHCAHQLSEWCLSYLANHYNEIHRILPKLLRNLHPENQAHLNKNRWPPIWYMKEFDYFEKCQTDRDREESQFKTLKRSLNNSGCLCFSGKARKNTSATV